MSLHALELMPFGLLFTWGFIPKLETTFSQKFLYNMEAVKLHALHLTTFLMNGICHKSMKNCGLLSLCEPEGKQTELAYAGLPLAEAMGPCCQERP